MLNVFVVGIGGFFGAALRYSASLLFFQLPAHNHFLATFTVNFLGCFLIGFVSQYDFKTLNVLRLFLITGILGGFTTYSAFGLETLTMLKQAQPLKASLYIIATVILCLGSVYLGNLVHRLIHY